MGRYYVASGHVQGTCSHRHTSVVGAAQCAYKHFRRCEEEGRFSDRRLMILQPGGAVAPSYEEDRQFQLAFEAEKNLRLRVRGVNRAATFVESVDRSARPRF